MNSGSRSHLSRWPRTLTTSFKNSISGTSIQCLITLIDPFKTDKPTLKKFVTTKLILKIERIAREMASQGYDSDPRFDELLRRVALEVKV